MAEIDFCLGLGINVLAYATNRQLKFKYEIPQNQDEATPSDAQRGTIFVAKLRHNGGCDEAPSALANILKTASAQLGLTVSTDRRLIAVTDKRLFDYHLVYMQGRRDFQFSTEERKILKTYLARGGMILADAINSSPEFAKAFRREIASVMPGSRLEPHSDDASADRAGRREHSGRLRHSPGHAPRAGRRGRERTPSGQNESHPAAARRP